MARCENLGLLRGGSFLLGLGERGGSCCFILLLPFLFLVLPLIRVCIRLLVLYLFFVFLVSQYRTSSSGSSDRAEIGVGSNNSFNAIDIWELGVFWECDHREVPVFPRCIRPVLH